MKNIYINILAFLVFFLVGICTTRAQEKLFNSSSDSRVHIQKEYPYYFSGQTMLLDVSLINLTNYQQSSTPEIVYLLLKDKTDKSIFFKKYLIKQGASRISVNLPSNLPTGYYELIGYTNWMKNFDQTYFFRDKISIFSLEESENTQAKYNVSFFPEGQSIVEGVPSRVSFKSTYPINESHDAFVSDERGKTIARTKISPSGWGSFYFKPEKNRQYVLNLPFKNELISHEIPKTASNGLSLSLSQTSNILKVLLRSSKKYDHNGDVTILATSNGTLLYKFVGKLDKGFLIAEIPTETIPSSLITVLVLGKNEMPLNSRTIYVDNQLKCQINLSDSVFSVRDNIDFTIDIPNANRYSGAIGLKVVPEKFFENEQQRFLAALSLGSVPESASSKDVFELDNQLISHSTNRDVFVEKPQHLFAKESYLHLKGVLQDEKTLPDSTKILFFVPGINMVYETEVDSTGVFKIPLLISFSGKHAVHFYAYTKDHSFDAPKITPINEEVTQILELTGLPTYNLSVQQSKNEYLASESISKSYEYFSPDKSQQPNNGFSISNMFDADITINMSDYYTFSTMEDIIREVLNGVALRRGKKSDRLTIYSGDKFYEDQPFIFIDNQPTRDLQLFLNLSPKDIKEIKVISSPQKLSKLGSFGSGGIIIVDTKHNKSISLDSSNFTFEARGLTLKNDPIGNIPDNFRIPDLRKVLSWQTVAIDNNDISSRKFQFQASDRPGKYVIEVTILGADGKVYYATKSIEVIQDKS